MIAVNKAWDRSPYRVFINEVRKSDVCIDKRKSDINLDALFTEVGIETVSLCNNDCSFCPVSTQNDTRPTIFMSDAVFNSIISQLKNLQFKGTVFPYINNEFLIDKKIFKRISHIRNELDGAVRIHLETNGKLLNYEKLVKLYESGVNQVVINDYADSFIDYFLFTKKVRNIIKLLKNKPISVTGLLVVQHRLKKQILNNRFGKVLGITDKIPENKFCDFPFFQLNINPSGDVFICCRDSYYEGKIENMNVEKIWHCEEYKAIRKGFMLNERILNICKKCTSSGTCSM